MKKKIENAALFLLTAAAVVIAVANAPESDPPAVHHYHGIETIILTADPDAVVTAPYWEREVARRWPNALMVISHGGSIIDEWVMMTPGKPAKVTDVASSLVERYPGREIVFIVCNPGHHVINIPNVHYALGDVWKYPDRSIPAEQVGRSDEDPEGVGNIYEFQ